MPRGYNNYSYVIDSSFQPFTMQEMLTPFVAYKEMSDANAAAYVDMQDKSDKFKYLAETLPEDSKARQIYEEYANQLQADASDFLKNGVSMNNNRALLNLKRNYAGTIGRLEQVDAIRRAQIKEQNTIRQQDPTRMFSRRADMTPFDKYLENPDLSYESYSGALLAKQVNNVASQVAKGLVDFRKTGKLDEFTNTWIEKAGMSVDDVIRAVNNPGDPGNEALLNTIVNNVIDTSGIKSWADNATLKDAYGWASQGLWGIVGPSKLHTFDDYGAKLRAQEESSNRQRAAEYAMKARLAQLSSSGNGSSTGVGGGSMDIVPRNIYSAKDVSQVKSNLKNYEKYFYTDSQGRTKLTQAGLDEYNRKVSVATPVYPTVGGGPIMSPTIKTTDSPFKQFIDSIGGADYISKKQVGNVGNLWNQYKQKMNNGEYDATKTTEFSYNIDSSQRGEMKDSIMLAARNGKLEEVDFDAKDNKFKSTGKELNVEDLNSDKFTVLETTISPYGNTVFIKNDKGEIKRYRLPKGINPTAEANVERSMADAHKLQQMITTGEGIDSKGKKVKLTSEQLEQAQEMYRMVLQNAYKYQSRLGVTNKTKEQEFDFHGE